MTLAAMERCFVIQPFDRGRFDKRYKDTFAPAIRKANLDPYRIDNDPEVVIPIDDIEAGIRDSRICFADITLDNPNVWFEVGYAIAAGKPIVLACCTSERGDKKFPFDVQHRKILTYSSESVGDFQDLEKEIVDRLTGLLKRTARITDLTKTEQGTEGLTPREMATLVAIAQNQSDRDEGVAFHQLETDMKQAGFTKLALNLSLRSLEAKKMITRDYAPGWNSDSYVVYLLAELGEQWLFRNEDKLILQSHAKPKKHRSDDLDFSDPKVQDDIPF